MYQHYLPVRKALYGGPLAEAQFRRALTISQGDPSVFVTHPLSLGLLFAAMLVVATPIVLRRVLTASSSSPDSR